jgi:tetratricopeptide (TPR) repeat protein
MIERLYRRVPALTIASALILAAAATSSLADGGGGGGSAGGTDDRYPFLSQPLLSKPQIAPKPLEPKSPGTTLTEPKKKKLEERKSELELIEGYKRAYALAHSGGYEAAFAAFKDLDRDDHPDVANHLGFVSRKLGQYDESKVWYERAHAANPNHTRTWQYYGLWHLEQGNRLKAEDHLEKIRLICGLDCRDYLLLKDALDSGKGSY